MKAIIIGGGAAGLSGVPHGGIPGGDFRLSADRRYEGGYAAAGRRILFHPAAAFPGLHPGEPGGREHLFHHHLLLSLWQRDLVPGQRRLQHGQALERFAVNRL